MNYARYDSYSLRKEYYQGGTLDSLKRTENKYRADAITYDPLFSSFTYPTRNTEETKKNTMININPISLFISGFGLLGGLGLIIFGLFSDLGFTISGIGFVLISLIHLAWAENRDKWSRQ